MKLDLNDLLKTKAPKLYAKLPRFIIRILEKIIKQKEANAVFAHCEGKRGLTFLISALNFMGINRKIIMVEEIDTNKRYIFASNHPLGCLDGLVIVETTSQLGSESKIIVNDILMNIEPLQPIFIPINKYGKQSQKNSISINDSFEAGDNVIFFPAGFCSRKIKGEIKDIEWRKTFVSKAIEYKRDIIPVFIDNTNSSFFYFVAALREKLGIKFNIEMILLPSEMFRNKVKKMKLIYGKPISYKEIVESGDIPFWVDKIKKECYELKKYSK